MIKILYVDDEPGLLEVGKLFLEMSNEVQVETALSAKEALRMLEDSDFEVVISDYLMPGINGISFLKTLRAEGNDIPFILFTGRGCVREIDHRGVELWGRFLSSEGRRAGRSVQGARAQDQGSGPSQKGREIIAQFSADASARS